MGSWTTTPMPAQTAEENVRYLAGLSPIPGAHVDYLRKLKDGGFEPGVIYDIGACVLHWTREAKRLWPDATYVLFDAFADAEVLYRESGDAYSIGVLSDRRKVVKWYENASLPGGNSYFREANDAVFPAHGYTERMTTTLDDQVSIRGFPLPDLVKIDVQGCERDVVAGGVRTLRHAEHLIVEMQHVDYNLGAPHADVTLPYIEQALGVRCVAPLFCNNGPDGDYGFTNKLLEKV